MWIPISLAINYLHCYSFVNGTKLNKSCRESDGPRCLNNLHTLQSKNMRREGKRHYKSKQISLVSRFEGRLPPTRPFQTNALSKREQTILLLTAPENLLPCTVPAPLVWASSAT